MTREGARKMLQLALENEVEEFVRKHSNLKGENGNKVVTKNLIHAAKRYHYRDGNLGYNPAKNR